VSAEFTNQAPCIEKRVGRGLRGFIRVVFAGVGDMDTSRTCRELESWLEV
jgi:hypothetical protein